LDSGFTQRSKSLLQSSSSLIDVKLLDSEDGVIIYIYDKGANNVMTIIGTVEDISKNDHS